MSEHQKVDGISYSQISGLDQDVFRCDAWRATISVPACAARWRKAQKARGDEAVIEWRLCASCPIGAAHAGEPQMPRAENFRSGVCCRCRRGTLRRLVHGRHCISCFNRQLELRRGANARGNAPIKAQAELRYRTLGIVLDQGMPSERRVEYTDICIDEQELIMSIGRVHEGHIAYLGLIPYGTHPAWRPEGLGGAKAIVVPPPEAIEAERRQFEKSRSEARQSTAGGRLRLAALGTSCLAGVRLTPSLRSPARPRLAPFMRDRLLAA